MDAWNRKELEADLSAYLDGELPPPRAAEVEALLRTSQDARDLLDALRAVSAALAELPRVRAPAEVGDRVRAAIAAPRRSEHAAALPSTAADDSAATRDGEPAGRRSIVLRLFHAARLGGVMAACILFGVVLHAWMQPSVTVLESTAASRSPADRTRAPWPGEGGFAFKDQAITVERSESNEVALLRPPGWSGGTTAPAFPAAPTGLSTEANYFAGPATSLSPDGFATGPVLRVEIAPQSQVEYDAARNVIASLSAFLPDSMDSLTDATPIPDDKLPKKPVAGGSAPTGLQALAGEPGVAGPTTFTVRFPTSQPTAVLAALERAAPQRVVLSMRVADAAAALSGVSHELAGLEMGLLHSAPETQPPETDRSNNAVAKRLQRDELTVAAELKQSVEGGVASQPRVREAAVTRSRSAPTSAPAAGETAPAPALADAATHRDSEMKAQQSPVDKTRTGRFAGGPPTEARGGRGGGRAAAPAAAPPAVAGRGLGADQSAMVMPQPSERAAPDDSAQDPDAQPAPPDRRPGAAGDDADLEPGPYALSSLWLRLVESLSFGPVSLGAPPNARVEARIEPAPPPPAVLEITIHPPPTSAPADP